MSNGNGCKVIDMPLACAGQARRSFRMRSAGLFASGPIFNFHFILLSLLGHHVMLMLAERIAKERKLIAKWREQTTLGTGHDHEYLHLQHD